jgi:3-oxoacyl-[acyl-carrier protein] reductase
MDSGLQDRTVLVTGASSGIGRATAIAFGKEGARVAITYHRNEEGANETAASVREAGGEALILPMDLGDSDSIRTAVEKTVAQWGNVDVSVNNAVEWGDPAPWPPDFCQIAPDQWRRMLRTSLEGVFDLVQAVIPEMRGKGLGRIVFLSSGTVEFGMPGEEAYAAAKAGLHGLARSLARELGSSGILVNVVMPGLTLTEKCLQTVPEMVRQAVTGQTPTGRLSSAEDVAKAIVFLSSAANGNITGEILHVSGGV